MLRGLRRSPVVTALAALVPVLLIVGVFASDSRAEPSSCEAGPTTSDAGSVITGTPCADVIVVTSPLVRKVYGGEGNDVIYANSSVTEVDGGPGNDTIYGELPSLETGSETPEGESFKAVAASFSEATTDAIIECKANEYCEGGNGNQTMKGGKGDDLIFGQRGDDRLYGGADADQLYGGIGDDALRGEEGNDFLSGGPGKDHVYGGTGNDLVRGDSTKDELFGDEGHGPQAGEVDTLSYATATTPGFEGNPFEDIWPGKKEVEGFPKSAEGRGVFVRLDGGRTTCASLFACNGNSPSVGGGDDEIQNASEFQNVIGSPFADVIIGSSAANKIYGGGGPDVIIGGGGADELYGGAEGDYIEGSSESTINGESGENSCISFKSDSNCLPTPSLKVVPREASTISAGVMAPINAPSVWPDAYFVGGEENDDVQTEYEYKSGTGFILTYKAEGSTEFHVGKGAETGDCAYHAKEIVCTLSEPPASVVMAGMNGNDTLSVAGKTSKLELVSSPVLLGGAGEDNLYGNGNTEDTLVDGPEKDLLKGFGYDDFLTNGPGNEDILEGGNGNDLLLSSTICEGDILDGSEESIIDVRGGSVSPSSIVKDNGVNDASWTVYPSPSSGPKGIVADIEEEKAGNESGPVCKSGAIDKLYEISTLEGSKQGDSLHGNKENNLLIGWGGHNHLYGRAGNDKLNGKFGLGETFEGGSGENRCVYDSSIPKGENTFENCTEEVPAHPPKSVTKSPGTIGKGMVALKGEVNPEGSEALYAFEWGTAAEYSSTEEFEHISPSVEESAGSGTSAVPVEKTISGLHGSTTYDYRVVSSVNCEEEESNEVCTTYGEVMSFETPSWSPTTTIETPTGVEKGNATLRGTVNPHEFDTTFHFNWGTTESYGNTIPIPNGEAGEGASAKAVSEAISGLKGETTYFYRLVAESWQGTSESKGSFTTPNWKPEVVAKAASAITETGATLNGTVNPKGFETKYWFEYGKTTSYGTKTAEVSAGSGTSSVEESKAISGLAAGTTYHFRMVASNSNGTTNGEDKSFTTNGGAPAVTTKPATGVVEKGASLKGTVNPHGVEAKYYFEYGLTVAYGTKTSEAGAGAGTSSIEESKAITGLAAGTTYHFRIVASNSYGTTDGADETVHTPAWVVQETTNKGTFNTALNGDTCTSATACIAVGDYVNSEPHNNVHFAAESWNGTTWSAVQEPPTSGGKGGIEGGLYDVSCTSSTACVAVGSISFESGKRAPAADKWNGTEWSLLEPLTPKEASYVFLHSVSCTSSESCTVVGQYFSPSDKLLIEHWNGKEWAIQEAPAPKEAKESSLNGVSCTSTTACVAVGSFLNSLSKYQPFAENLERNGMVCQRTACPDGS